MTPSDPPATPPRRIATLIPRDGQEPLDNLSETQAAAVWAAVSAPWHPAVLGACDELPRVEDVAFPTPPEAGELRVVAAGTIDQLPSGFRTQAEDAGVAIVEATADRAALVRELAARRPAAAEPGDPADAVALDFLALGSARWWLRDATIAMGHVDCLDGENLAREALGAARAWCAGDHAAARNHLRGAFELLTQARERFYPVDAYLVDLCLLDPGAANGALADALDARAPVTIIAPARAVEIQAARDPERLAALREAINEGWADVAGGTYGEPDEPLRPLESIFWQFRKAYQTYRRHLDDRAVETLVRRRFGLYPQLPQVARRFGFRYGVHLGLDEGRFPLPLESKRMWEAPDGSSLEALTRPPIAADREAEGPRLAWRIGRAMKEDHVATLAIVRWPGRAAGWYLDLRRIAGYSPVFLRWVTLNDYFHLTDRPFEPLRPLLDEYAPPYLAQSAARGDVGPIGRRVAQTALRARLDGVSTLRALAFALGAGEPAVDEGVALPEWSAAEDAAESGRLDEASTALDALEPAWAGVVARSVAGLGGSSGRPGYLVLNPLAVERRAAVRLPDAAADLRPEGPLRAAQFTEDGVWAVVDLPAYGYAWVPRETALDIPPASLGTLGVSGSTLRNESMEVVLDEATGGLRSLRAPGEPSPRLGQQLVVRGLGGESGTRMRAERFDVDYGGPALVQAVTAGVVEDAEGRPLLRFHQRVRLWTGRPMLELDMTLSELEAGLIERLAGGDPWQTAIACRWAWPDPDADLRRTSLLAPEPTTAQRPETPDVLDISTRRQRTALLFGGLAHHVRHGTRMLDTLLVAGCERSRQFRLGVVLDQEYPYQAAQEWLAPAPVVPIDTGPPAAGPTGWLFQKDARGVAITRAEPLPASSDEGRGPGVAFHLIETTGRAARCRLRLPSHPTRSRQTDLVGEPILDLTVDGDAVTVDLTPHEMARVEITLG